LISLKSVLLQCWITQFGTHTDDDEPLQSGVGEISKDCSDEQIAAWSDIVTIWPVGSTVRPKQLSPLVKAGIPGNCWLTLVVKLTIIIIRHYTH
jgi:hypothetical protein